MSDEKYKLLEVTAKVLGYTIEDNEELSNDGGIIHWYRLISPRGKVKDASYNKAALWRSLELQRHMKNVYGVSFDD